MITDNGQQATDQARWLHCWALLTVCATLFLLLLGSVVTTFRVGMADPIWPTYPWHLLLISWEEPSAGYLVEHSHRLAGYVVGCCIIVLAVGLWLQEPRRWVRWLGTAALAGVIFQGLLGGFRVLLNALVGTDFALVHGCFAQVVFALLVSLALFTSPGWKTAPLAADSARLRRWSLYTTGLLYLQIVLGAVLRHTHSPLGQRGHLLVAFAAVAAVVWLVRLVFETHAGERALTSAVMILAMLVTAQLFLGVESWMLQFSPGGLPELQRVTVPHALIRTAHVLLGFCILAASVVLTCRAHRSVNIQFAAAPISRLEGAA